MAVIELYELFDNYLKSVSGNKLKLGSKYSYVTYTKNLCRNILDNYAHNIIGNSCMTKLDE